MSRISQTAGFIAAYEFCISHLYIAKKFMIFQNFLIICLCTLTLLICTCCLPYFFNTKRPFRNFHSKWPYSLQRQEAFGLLMFYSRSDPEPAFLICVYRYKYKFHKPINTRYCCSQLCISIYGISYHFQWNILYFILHFLQIRCPCAICRYFRNADKFSIRSHAWPDVRHGNKLSAFISIHKAVW